MKTQLILFFCCLPLCLSTQINYTANDQVPPYQETFGYGTNLGVYSGWNDIALANISAGNPALNIPGIGCNTMRPNLPESFLDFWGYNIRLTEFQHYASLGMRDHTVFIGYAAEAHRDPVEYCPGNQSQMFANTYLDIWDGGENGTPYNDDNYYAAYVYQMVDIYKDYVGFWEVWNEPDFDYSGNGYKAPGEPGNWWENVPDPCDYQLRTPIYHYIRLLRITYEVVKYLDPEAYVTVGGIGFPSFLDLILRHSDNPDGGAVTAAYPLQGGAYFDAVSYHFYPHFDGSLRYWDNDVGGFVFTRHSDAASTSIKRHKDDYQAVLDTYGYNGLTYPNKEWIITESNLPAESFNSQYLGSPEAQRNYITKAIVEAQREGVSQLHFYKIAEDAAPGQAVYEFQRMGFYQDLSTTPPYAPIILQSGIANKTISDAIRDARFHAAQTQALSLPDGVKGAAFQHPDNHFTYVLWAETQTDNTEAASATYSFPSNWNLNNLEKKEWNYSQTGNASIINANNINLTGAPVFLVPQDNPNPPPIANFSATPQSLCPGNSVQFTDLSTNASSWNWSFPGGSPSSSTAQNPIITYNNSGVFSVTLTATNDVSSDQSSQNNFISIANLVVANYNASTDQFTANFFNTSTDATQYTWDFGDGSAFSSETNPSHVYAAEGSYTVKLTASNACGMNTYEQLIVIAIAPVANFTWMLSGECAPFTLSLQGNSTGGTPTNWLWQVSNLSTNLTSTEQNPTFLINDPDLYSIMLTASNTAGSSSISESVFVGGAINPTLTINVNICEGDSYFWNGTDYDTEGEYSATFTNVAGCDSIVILDLDVGDMIMTDFEVSLCAGDLYDGTPYYGDTTLNYSYTSVNYCDSLVEIRLEVNPVYATTLDETICTGDAYNGTPYYEDTTLNYSYASIFGCDSLVEVSLLVNPVYAITLNETVPAGGIFMVGNNSYNNSGTYLDTLDSSNGCDSIIQLNLTVEPVGVVELPNNLSHFKAQPNPFSNAFEIEFGLEKVQSVSILLYDVRGVLQQTILFEEKLNAQTHRYKVEASALPSGVYLCQIKTAEGEAVVKMIK